MASASARMVAMNVFSITSGLSTPAPAIAGPEIPIPRPAPIADRRTLSPAPKPAQNVGQRVTEESVEQSTAISWYNPAHWFLIGREWVAGPFIKLTKPFNPVNPQRLNENNQALENHNKDITEYYSDE